jgi:hypothetical protein
MSCGRDRDEVLPESKAKELNSTLDGEGQSSTRTCGPGNIAEAVLVNTVS